MLKLGIIIKIIISIHIQFIASSVSLSNEWNDWIILPVRSETSFEGRNGSENFGVVVDVNSSKSVNSRANSEQMESFIMRTVSMNGPWKQNSQKQESEIQRLEARSDLAIPLGRSIEKVKTFCSTVMEFLEENLSNIDDNREQLAESSRKLKKLKKKYKKFLFPLLLAYKLKFLALIPLLISGLVLLVGTTGMAGFFFALFTAVMSLKSENKVELNKIK